MYGTANVHYGFPYRTGIVRSTVPRHSLAEMHCPDPGIPIQNSDVFVRSEFRQNQNHSETTLVRTMYGLSMDRAVPRSATCGIDCGTEVSRLSLRAHIHPGWLQKLPSFGRNGNFAAQGWVEPGPDLEPDKVGPGLPQCSPW